MVHETIGHETIGHLAIVIVIVIVIGDNRIDMTLVSKT